MDLEGCVRLLTERVSALEKRMDELNTRTIGQVRFGPLPEPSEEKHVNKAREIADKIAAQIKAMPVDWNARSLEDGSPITEDHKEINPVTGQQKNYVVLTDEERSKGFVRPVRTEYTHLKCGTVTSMSLAIAETYAREPKFYSGTFCVQCREHFPLDQFVWKNSDEQVGS